VHMVATGRTIVEATDNSIRKAASDGNNQIWNFSNLKSTIKDSIRYGMPFWYSGYQYFNNANHAAIRFSQPNNVIYRQIENDAMYDLGNFDSSSGSTQIFVFKTKSLSFPSTYQTAFNDENEFNGLSLELGIDIDSTGPMPYLDSLRFSTRVRVESKINGSGQLTIPLGSFNALKQTLLKQTTQILYVFANQKWVPASDTIINYLKYNIPKTDSNYTCHFWTNSKGVGVPLMTYQYNKNDTSINSVKWLQTKPHFNSVLSNTINHLTHVYPVPCQDHLNISAPISGKYRILDAMGKIVATGLFEEQSIINLLDFKSGIYIIQLLNEKNELMANKKFIKS
jgi:hypothetical protein